jgi:hypothetical protein
MCYKCYVIYMIDYYIQRFEIYIYIYYIVI